ncbi:MAG: SDR family oxidoreductase, partial [Acidobacteria bacterium]|nr:SDR family oxidoreductase [Acidobacteriota bacterium]
RAPLKRNVDASEVAEVGVFLLGPQSRGITGEVIMVDAGYHIAGM